MRNYGGRYTTGCQKCMLLKHEHYSVAETLPKKIVRVRAILSQFRKPPFPWFKLPVNHIFYGRFPQFWTNSHLFCSTLSNYTDALSYFAPPFVCISLTPLHFLAEFQQPGGFSDKSCLILMTPLRPLFQHSQSKISGLRKNERDCGIDLCLAIPFECALVCMCDLYFLQCPSYWV